MELTERPSDLEKLSLLERPSAEPAATRASTAPVTLTATAYSRIRNDVLSNAFEPGRRITIQFLQQRYGIGPTPLREALARLAADGFVIGEDNRGFRVPPMSLGALRDITDQRKLIETQGLRLSIERGGEAYSTRVVATYRELEQLDYGRTQNVPTNLLKWEPHHRRFHTALISGSNSEWLVRFQGILFDQADRYRRLYSDGKPLNPEIPQDHQRILEATLDKDAPMATLLLERHIERVYATAERSRRLPEG